MCEGAESQKVHYSTVAAERLSDAQYRKALTHLKAARSGQTGPPRQGMWLQQPHAASQRMPWSLQQRQVMFDKVPYLETQCKLQTVIHDADRTGQARTVNPASHCYVDELVRKTVCLSVLVKS